MQYPLDINQYEIQKIIGRGATSEVYAARCKTNGRLVAIKIIDLEVCPMEIESLRAEVAFWSSCNHPNIVDYYGSFVNGSVIYILMEYMSGGSMYEILRYAFKNGIPNEPIIATILHEVLRAITYFHENKQIHRDIKAGNILMNEKGEIKIGDFGIAANLLENGQRKLARFTVIGTPCYMAPEILAAGIGYTEKADIWSLGITAIELAVGSAPYSNLYPLEVIVHISNDPPPTLPKDGKYSTAFRSFISACLQSNPNKRYTANQLLEHKFMKQLIKPNQITQFVLNGLPSLQERFAIVHSSKFDNQENTGALNTGIDRWDFGDSASSTAETPLQPIPPKQDDAFVAIDKIENDQESDSAFEPIEPEPEPAPVQEEKHTHTEKHDSPKPETKSISPPPTESKNNEPVEKKTKFTITHKKTTAQSASPPSTQSDTEEEAKIEILESQVNQLHEKISQLTATNTSLKEQISTLATSIRNLMPA